jgi:hypothetical protein
LATVTGVLTVGKYGSLSDFHRPIVTSARASFDPMPLLTLDLRELLVAGLPASVLLDAQAPSIVTATAVPVTTSATRRMVLVMCFVSL